MLWKKIINVLLLRKNNDLSLSLSISILRYQVILLMFFNMYFNYRYFFNIKIIVLLAQNALISSI